MSYAYRLKWKRAVKVVHGSARLSMSLDMLQLLPQDEMVALLQKQLSALGWQSHEEKLTKSLDTLDLTFDPKSQKVEASLKQSQEMSAQAHTISQAHKALESTEREATDALNKSVNHTLMKGENKVREHLQEALRITYLAALKIKAARMGEVQSVQEHHLSDGTQELVIKVKA